MYVSISVAFFPTNFTPVRHDVGQRDVLGAVRPRGLGVEGNAYDFPLGWYSMMDA